MTRTWMVLLVEGHERRAAQIHAWLTRDGYSVAMCSGPVAPTYSCPHESADRCPLAELADLVLLDLSMDADTVMEGVPGWVLLDQYRSAGKPVVALCERGSMVEELVDSSVAVLGRNAGPDEIAEAVGLLLNRARELENEGATG